jgi:cytochrome c oxidase cbb3-type subunit III
MCCLAFGLMALAQMVSSRPALYAAAADPKTQEQNKAAVRDGGQIFASQCAGCHGLDGKGGERAPDIATSAKTQRRSDEELFYIIEKGVPGTGMPAFSSLSQREKKSIVAHVRSLQGQALAVALPGDRSKGRSLFYGKARCAECHIVSGAGGFIAGDLTSYGANKSVDDIRSAIVKPNSMQRPGTGRTELTTRDGRKYSGVVRNEDNFSVQLQTLDGAFRLFDKAELESLRRVTEPLMPTDYGSTLNAGELNDLISFLIATARETKSAQPKKAAHGDDEEYDDD